MKKLIINADDFGLTDGVCKGIVELFETNAISNTTVMACVEGVAGRCKKYLGDYSKYAGVHLQITPENDNRFPLSDPDEIPSLLGDDGGFKPVDYDGWRNPDEVQLEWARQIEAFIDIVGHAPSHIDTHQGNHRIEELTPVYLTLAAKYNCSVRGGIEAGQINGDLLDVKSSALTERNWTGQNKSLAELKDTIINYLPNAEGGVLEIVCHPGHCDDDLIKASPWNKVRENDHKQLLALSKENWLAEQGIDLIRFNDLKNALI